jgi:hypothetical protein
MRRRFSFGKNRELKDFLIRFYPAGDYTWIVPDGCFLVDVFLVGGGGSGSAAGGGGGYTKTFKSDSKGWKDGEAIAVEPGQSISITVGKGGKKVHQAEHNSPGKDGGYSQFMNPSYRAGGGKGAATRKGGSGGSAGSSVYTQNGASDGGDTYGEEFGVVEGQGHTTRDFGEPDGKRNAGGGSGETNTGVEFRGGISDYSEGSGKRGSTKGAGRGGGGYGGGGGGVRYSNVYSGAGGDGTVLIRGKRYVTR